MSNYLVVLFKNKKKKKIIKKFVTLSRAKNYFEELINKSNEVIFEVLVENGKDCKFELALICSPYALATANLISISRI